eukprot:COSAG06_NODE_1178_length_10397_cov_22.429889_2_plen_153_part_00
MPMREACRRPRAIMQRQQHCKIRLDFYIKQTQNDNLTSDPPSALLQHYCIIWLFVSMRRDLQQLLKSLPLPPPTARMPPGLLMITRDSTASEQGPGKREGFDQPRNSSRPPRAGWHAHQWAPRGLATVRLRWAMSRILRGGLALGPATTVEV